jgi:hypothetical protein
MNSLKNLMIIGVLAAVGYGMYVSLQRTNVDSGQSFTAPKLDMSNVRSSTSHSLPLSGSSLPSAGASSLGASGLNATTAPPLAPPPLAPAPTNNSLGTGDPAPAMPYPSANTATSPSNLPEVPPLNPPAGVASSPDATLGTPVPPESAPSLGTPGSATGPSAVPALPSENPTPTGVVRNLAPPPDTAPSDLPSNPSTAGSTATAIATTDPKAADGSLQNTFDAFMDAVRKKLAEDKLAEAQLALSKMYAIPNLPADQAKQITDLLDQLAGTVIYSRQHYLAPPYRTRPGDTIDAIAKKYNVPWQLLAKINGLMPPGASIADTATKDQPLPEGKELKVLKGPFNAVVQLDKRELTLMVQDRYAGRFPIGVGRDIPKLDGEYTVGAKTLNPTYYGPDGINIAPSDPKNPLGGAWIGLTDRIGIHGAADPQSIGRDSNRGTICVGDRDLQDLYGILSVGSRVTIRR